MCSSTITLHRIFGIPCVLWNKEKICKIYYVPKYIYIHLKLMCVLTNVCTEIIMNRFSSIWHTANYRNYIQKEKSTQFILHFWRKKIKEKVLV